MLRISRKVAIPSSTMMSRPIGPATTSDIVSTTLFCSNTLPTLRADLLVDAREEVGLGRRAVDERADQLVLFPGPDLALDRQRRAEPGAVRVDLGGVGAERVVAYL